MIHINTFLLLVVFKVVFIASNRDPFSDKARDSLIYNLNTLPFLSLEFIFENWEKIELIDLHIYILPLLISLVLWNLYTVVFKLAFTCDCFLN